MIRRKGSAELPSKWLIVGAMMIFLGTAFIAIFVNSFVFNYGLHLDQSISHYVGLELWSAIMFTLGNIFVGMFVANYLWKMGLAWKMPRIFYLVVVILVAALIALSVFPSGIYNDGSGKISIVTWAHMLSSRGMFIMMMLVAAMIILRRRANRAANVACAVYLVYAVICVVGYMTAGEWFTKYLMIFETVYLAGFMTVLAVCDEKREKLDDFAKSDW